MLKSTNIEQRFWLPSPPSTNNLFVNTPGVGRKPSTEYAAWKRLAMHELTLQKPKRLEGKITLAFFIGLRSPVADCSNFIKAPEDLLVEAGIITGDNAKIVQGLSACWVPNFLGMIVHITPYVESEPLWLDFDKGVFGQVQATSPSQMGVHPSALGKMNKASGRIKPDPAKSPARQHAANIILRNPTLSVFQLAKIGGVTEGTIRNAKKDLIKDGRLKRNLEA